jgi:hypothetical protein
VAAAPAGEVVIDHGEIREHAWMRIDEVMQRRDAGEIELAPPTWISLHSLVEASDVLRALEALRGQEPQRFETHIKVGESGPVAIWRGDAGYEDSDLDRPGARHRLIMQKERWTYLRHD